MAATTNIAWCDSTWNPWIGCTKVGPGCDHCYASVSTPARSLGVVWGAGQPRRRTSESNWKKPIQWNARPFDIQWARDTVRQCREAGVACFVKQLGSNIAPVPEADKTGLLLCPKTGGATPILTIRDRAGADPAEWPDDLRVREFPA